MSTPVEPAGNAETSITCSLSTFLLWVKKRETVPEDEDEVYVVGYDYKLSKKTVVMV